MKSGKISACTFKQSFNSQHGMMHSHSITLDNGDSGEINSKEQMPPFLAAGKTLWYELIPNGKYAPKIKRMKAPDEAQPEQSSAGNLGKEIMAQLTENAKEIEALKEVVKQLVKHTKMVYVKPKQYEPDRAGFQPRSEMAAQAASDDFDRYVDDNSSPF